MIDLTHLRVLLVEDNELDARSMLTFLARSELAEFDTHRVADLGAALRIVEEDTFDCILLDLSLPDAEGLISVDALLKRSAHAPVVVLTGIDDPTIAVEAVARGAQDYLMKQSADAEVVARAIRYAVARHHSDNALRNATELLHLMQDRDRIARDLHDTVIQQLFATGMALQAVAPQTPEGTVRNRVSEAVESIDDAIRQLREAIFGLHEVSHEGRISAALVDVAESEQAALGFMPSIRIGALERVSPALCHELVATLTEALSNIAKHANATAAEITVDTTGDCVVLTVTDNGRGIDPRHPRPSPSTSGVLTGHGLHNMTTRARELDGKFRIGPGPGGGTELEWSVPLEAD